MSKEQIASNNLEIPAVFERDYPVRRLLILLSDAWTPIILYCLSDREKRFSELQRHLPDISKKMLTQVLRRLERDGIVHRTAYDVIPPKTEYRLTKCGQKFLEPLDTLCQWARENEETIDAVYKERRQR